MHIVDVCAFYSPHGGGVKTYVERKLRAGLWAGHQVTILAPSQTDGEEAISDRARIVHVPGRRFPLDGRYSYFHDESALHAALDEVRPDIVEASSPWTSAAMVGRWQRQVPRVLVMHADPLATYAYRWFAPFMGRSAVDRGFSWFWEHLRRLDTSFDRVLTASRNLADRLSEGGLRSLVTIPMGVEPGLFTPRLRDNAIRARLLAQCGLGEEATLLVGVGRHTAEKRWPMVIDAVTAAGAHHPVGLVLIGGGRDTARILHHSRNNPHILFIDPVQDRDRLARLVASCDGLVHGCESETFCMVASEAQASGLPIIVPDRGGAADQARDGVDILYRSADARSLLDALHDFLASDRAARLTRAGLASAGVRSMDQHFVDLFDLYEGLARDDRRAWEVAA